jgi:RNA polymerase sigma-70 factor (ECF subfamily)
MILLRRIIFLGAGFPCAFMKASWTRPQWTIRAPEARIGGRFSGPKGLRMASPIDPSEYSDFIRRVREGDDRAAEELVRRYEPEIRLEIRGWLRLRDPRLRRVFDSTDICQSVLANFFVRAAIGEFDLDEPTQLIRLLVGMARNKLSEEVRHHHRQRRDVRRAGPVAPDGAPIEVAAKSAETPSQVVSHRELLEAARDRLSPEERQLAELRRQGHDWAAVALEMGGTAEGRRKQLARAMARIEQELGLGSIQG